MIRAVVGGALSLAACPALAHGFGQAISLPLPFELYASGAVGAVLLTFALAVLALRRPPASRASVPQGLRFEGSVRLLPKRLSPWRGLPALAMLLVCIVGGFVGVRNPFNNLNMTLFWVVFILWIPYVAAVLGNINAVANPFYALGRLVERSLPMARMGIFPGVRPAAGWVAVGLYMAFVCVELFGFVLPHTLAILLLAYSGITVLGCLLFGSATWLREGECFGRLIRLLALCAPHRGRWALAHVAPNQPLLGMPFARLLGPRLRHPSEMVFLLFLLTATSFDGLHETRTWVSLFWVDLADFWENFFSPPLIQHYVALDRLYLVWQLSAMVLAPFVYGLLFWLCSARGRESSHYAFTLVPIILVYHLGHYLSLAITQGSQVIPLLSDPFGWGQNLFGTALWFRPPLSPDPRVIWDWQVFLIVLGHGVSVWLAHIRALELRGAPWPAFKSQLGMLAFMVGLTWFGLWILAQPFSPPGAVLLQQTY